jgi:hypothetical protein
MKFNILFTLGGLMLLEAFAVAAPVACKRDSIVSPAFTLRGHSLTAVVRDWTRCREATGYQLAVGARINTRMSTDVVPSAPTHDLAVLASDDGTVAIV